MHWIERAPLLLVGLAIVLGLLAAHEVARRLTRRAGTTEARSETRGYLVSSALALLGLLMGFTFNAAQERFRLRQELVVSEANALGTSYLRYQVLDQPWRDELSRDLLRYAQVRVRFADAQTPDEIELNARQGAPLQAAIWSELTGAIRAGDAPSATMALLLATNEMFDVAAARRAAREYRLPVSVLRSLLFSALTVVAIMGYTAAGERRDAGVLLGVLLVLALTFCLILDLDRPSSGSVRISEAAMQRAVADIRSSEAAKAASAAPAASRPSP